VKQIAKDNDKQIGKDFLQLLDRKIYEKVEKMIKDIRFKRLSAKDLIS
jgi:hypothetical protein